jgi:hypothetical protein
VRRRFADALAAGRGRGVGARAVKELGIIGFEILPPGLPVALGDSFYDPVYAAAEKCGAVLGIHGARNWSREFGAEGLNTFAEVHAYAFTAGILLQFTSMICQGCRFVFPNCAWRSWRLARPGCRTTWIASTSIGKTRSIRDAPAQRKTQPIGEKIGGLLQHRVG